MLNSFVSDIHGQGPVRFDESGVRVYRQVELFQFRNGKCCVEFPCTEEDSPF